MKESDNKNINVVAKDYIHLMTYMMVGVILVGPEIVKILASKIYWEGIIIIPPVVLANFVIFAYTLYVNIEHYHKKTIYITFNTIIAAGTNIILNFILIPKYGYIAAAYTTLISYLIAFLLHSRYAKKLESTLYPLKVFLVPFFHLLVAIVLFYVFIENYWVRWIFVIIYALAILCIEKNRMVAYFPSLRYKKRRE